MISTPTHELESNDRLPFLDILVIRDENDIKTTIYLKPTNDKIYLHWSAFTPVSWRIRTLKSLVLRAYKACSAADYRKRELKHLTETFCNNGYPLAIIKYTMEKIENVSIIIPTTSRKVTYSITFKSYMISLAYCLMVCLVGTMIIKVIWNKWQ